MSNATKSAANFATYSIHTHAGQILIRDEDGAVIHSEPSDLTIDASTNSHLVAGQLHAAIPGWLVDVEHDHDTIFVTTTELAWHRPMNWRFRVFGEMVIKMWREGESRRPNPDTRTDDELMGLLWGEFADQPGRHPDFALTFLEEQRFFADQPE